MNDYQNIIFMKIGYHSSEDLESIIKRKKEEDSNGYFYWGYGGTICHPLNQVRPFCKDKKVYLLMSITKSKFEGKSIESYCYSINNKDWLPLPDHILVTSSKYALVCKNLKEVDFDINLNDYEVGIGNNKGKSFEEYIGHRIDKGCAIKKKNSSKDKNNNLINIKYMAELVEPYSVFIK